MSKVDNREFVQNLLDELNNLSSVTETYTLPTKGKLDGIPETVTLRMMTTHEEKLRTGGSGSFWRVMADVINNCIVEPKGLDSYTLTVVDFIFLMYKLRIVTYGKEYRVNLNKCPLCKKPIKNAAADLDKLKITYIDEMPTELQSEPFDIKLPRTGWDISCRMLRMNEFDEIEAETERIYKDFPDYEGDPSTELRLARQIVKIKGQSVDKFAIRALIEKLPAEDENVITQTLEQITMGLDLNYEYTCPKCGKKFMIPLAWSDEFFRPTHSKE